MIFFLKMINTITIFLMIVVILLLVLCALAIYADKHPYGIIANFLEKVFDILGW